MADDYFKPELALNPATDSAVPYAVATIYALSDTDRLTPLAITDMFDIPMSNLVAGPNGIYPAFKTVSGVKDVNAVAGGGSLVTPLTSVQGNKGEQGEPGQSGIGLPDAENLPDGYVPVTTGGVWSAGPAPASGGTGTGGVSEGTLYYVWNGTAYVDRLGQTPPVAKPAGWWVLRQFLTNGDPNAPFPTYPTWAGVEDRWARPAA